MASETPQLQLSDLLFNIATQVTAHPAGNYTDASSGIDAAEGASREISPEPPDEHEVLAMRMRAVSIRDSKGKGRQDSDGNELVDMVLRLTSAVPASTQVLEQADTIRRLSLQRDILLHRMDEDRERWEAERDGLQRVCEALIAQANIASHNLYKEQDSAKKPAIIEAENNSLRQKLAEVQGRISSLEAELAQLRPLLLMQPSAVAASRGLTLSPSKPAKKEDTNSGGGVEGMRYYRVREVKTDSPKSKKKKASSYFQHAPAVADARSEHLLLAMRKLGKERATLLSQAMYRTTDSPQASIAPNNEPDLQAKNSTDPLRPTISPAVWPSHVQQATNTSQQAGQAKQQTVQKPGTPGSIKGQQNPPFSQYGPPAGLAYRPYFMPSGSVARPGTAMPAPAFYHGPPRGYIPGPAWPYYTPGPYAFGQPIAIQNASTANAKAPSSPTRHTKSPPVASSSHVSALTTPQVPPVSSSSERARETSQSPGQEQTSPGRERQQSGLSTPLSNATAPGSVARNTPMDDLLSAAQTVFSPNTSSRARTPEDEGSPAPKKRRRVDNHGHTVTTRTKDKQTAVLEPSGSTDRRTSALDVLADQAAGVVPSARASQSESVGRNEEGSSAAIVSQHGLERGKISTKEGSSRISSARNGKRPIRASSITPITATSPSLVPPTTGHRATSEDRAAPVSSDTFRASTESFKLRPVQSVAFPSKGSRSTQGRSSSLPRTSTSRGDAGRIRHLNGRASTSLSRGQPGLSRANASVLNNADAEDELESEEGDDEGALLDQNVEFEGDDAGAPIPKECGRTEKGKHAGEPAGPGEDANSRRWLEILGRKEP